MKVVVLGAGVVGVTTAYLLAREGVEVTVVDRQDDVAQETSAVNAGLIAPGHAFTWASPRAPRTLLRSLLGQDTALRMHLRFDPELVRWGMRFLANCTTDRARTNTLKRLRLCQYSRNVLDELVGEEADLTFHRNDRGALFLFRNDASMEVGVRRLALLAEHGEAQEILDADGCAALDPAFAPVKDKIVGAVFSPTAMSGDSSLFTRGLADRCRELGVEFQLSTTVERFDMDRGAVTGVVTDQGTVRGDRYVLSLGTASRAIGRTAGLDVPIYPVKGYTLTAPVVAGATAPSVSGIDEDRLVAWSRFGDSLRMTGTADFAGHDRTLIEDDARSIFRSGGDLFPDSVDWEQRRMQVGLRPVTPNEFPLIGRSRHDNLHLNTGHGNLGWTMAAGSARIATDLLLDRQPSLDLSDLRG